MSEPYVDPYALRHPLDYGMARSYSGGYIGPGASNVSTYFLPLFMLALYSSRFSPSAYFPLFCFTLSFLLRIFLSVSPSPRSLSCFPSSFLACHLFFSFYFSSPPYPSSSPFPSFSFLTLSLFTPLSHSVFSFSLHSSPSSLCSFFLLLPYFPYMFFHYFSPFFRLLIPHFPSFLFYLFPSSIRIFLLPFNELIL